MKVDQYLREILQIFVTAIQSDTLWIAAGTLATVAVAWAAMKYEIGARHFSEAAL